MTATRKTFTCQCGHLAYWINYRGWMCFCGQPTTQRGVRKASPAKGALVR